MPAPSVPPRASLRRSPERLRNANTNRYVLVVLWTATVPVCTLTVLVPVSGIMDITISGVQRIPVLIVLPVDLPFPGTDTSVTLCCCLYIITIY